jgi:hypothetical protein
MSQWWVFGVGCGKAVSKIIAFWRCSNQVEMAFMSGRQKDPGVCGIKNAVEFLNLS